MREGKSGIGRDPRSCGPAAARLQNALQVLQVRRRSLRKTISNWRARKGGLSDMVATAAAIVPATVAARGARGCRQRRSRAGARATSRGCSEFLPTLGTGRNGRDRRARTNYQALAATTES